MSFNHGHIPYLNSGALNINLGSGSAPIEEKGLFINIDLGDFDCVDIVRDIEKHGLPFSDSTVDNIFSSDFIEHVGNWVFLFNEIWRVLKPVGIFDAGYPLGGSEGYIAHPPHKQAWYPGSFIYLTKDAWCIDAHKAYGIRTNFEIVVNEQEGDPGKEVGHIQMRALKNYPGGFRPLLTSDLFARPMGDPQAIRVDIGCGSNKQTVPGRYIGVDKREYPGVDVVKNVERGMPFADRSVDYVYASHFLEHVDDLIFVMDEIWRVLKKKGIFYIVSPLWTTKYAYAHPDHKRLIHPKLWNWWEPEREGDREHYGAKAQFAIVKNEEKGNGLFTTLMAVK